MDHSLSAISPLDGRYFNKVKELSPIFSESALIKYRLRVEIEYLIALAGEAKIKELKEFSPEEKNQLREIYQKFDLPEAEKIKKIEAVTNHDVKAVEYYLKEKIGKNRKLLPALEFVHFGLTSYDVNNLAYSLMLRDGAAIYQKELKTLLLSLKDLAKRFKNISLLSLTHGQPASSTTLGKELAIFYWRLNSELANLHQLKLKGKFSGAVGNWNAHCLTYPKVDWTAFSQKFVEGLGLEFNPLTTQIEPYDSAASVYHNLIRINTILKDLSQDLWLYVSRDIFKLKKIKGEVGSSTMPHKVNPIDFENSEGNLGLANALLNHLAEKLPVSRLQRDLSDSTVIRNQGAALGYGLLALKSLIKGLLKLEVNRQIIETELNNHWEVLAEAIQVVLRKAGYPKPYEKLKQLTRGEKVTKAGLQKFIRSLKIDKTEKATLLKLTPEKYIGLAVKLVDKYLDK